MNSGGETLEKMSLSEYEKYKSAIIAANDSEDKEALRQIQRQIIAKYGLDNSDVHLILQVPC